MYLNIHVYTVRVGHSSTDHVHVHVVSGTSPGLASSVCLYSSYTEGGVF